MCGLIIIASQSQQQLLCNDCVQSITKKVTFSETGYKKRQNPMICTRAGGFLLVYHMREYIITVNKDML